MRIGFDVSQTAETMAGCGVFAHELFTHLVETAPQETFIPYPIFHSYRNAAFRGATRPAASNVEARHHDVDWRTLNAGWDAAGDRHAFLGAPDVVHSNSFGCPRRIGAPLVYTLYDMSPIEHPEYHTEVNRVVCFNGLFEASLHAEAFIAISAFTRNRFLAWFPHVPAGRVRVIHPAARTGVFDGSGSNERDALVALGLEPERFWLSVGTIEPRKNYAALLEAYARVRQRDPDSPMLCIAGQAGWTEASLDGRIGALGLTGHVRCLGFVPDRQLGVLYRHCFAFVFPSHYEGFGLPVIEALANGAAVIASGAASLPEVVGDAGLLIDPASVDSLEAAMLRVSTSVDTRAHLRRNAARRAAMFSWRSAASDVLRVYEDVRGQAAMAPSTVVRR